MLLVALLLEQGGSHHLLRLSGQLDLRRGRRGPRRPLRSGFGLGFLRRGFFGGLGGLLLAFEQRLALDFLALWRSSLLGCWRLLLRRGLGGDGRGGGGRGGRGNGRRGGLFRGLGRRRNGVGVLRDAGLGIEIIRRAGAEVLHDVPVGRAAADGQLRDRRVGDGHADGARRRRDADIEHLVVERRQRTDLRRGHRDLDLAVLGRERRADEVARNLDGRLRFARRHSEAAEDREVDDRRRVDVGHVHRQGYRREG